MFHKVKEASRGTAILDWILPSREELVANLQGEGKNGREMTDLIILRQGRSESSRIRAPDFEKADFNNRRELVS